MSSLALPDVRDIVAYQHTKEIKIKSTLYNRNEYERLIGSEREALYCFLSLNSPLLGLLVLVTWPHQYGVEIVASELWIRKRIYVHLKSILMSVCTHGGVGRSIGLCSSMSGGKMQLLDCLTCACRPWTFKEGCKPPDVNPIGFPIGLLR